MSESDDYRITLEKLDKLDTLSVRLESTISDTIAFFYLEYQLIETTGESVFRLTPIRGQPAFEVKKNLYYLSGLSLGLRFTNLYLGSSRQPQNKIYYLFALCPFRGDSGTVKLVKIKLKILEFESKPQGEYSLVHLFSDAKSTRFLIRTTDRWFVRRV